MTLSVVKLTQFMYESILLVSVTEHLEYLMKKLLVQTNGNQRLEIDNKNIKDLEAIEKKDIPTTKQVRVHSFIC